MSGIHWLRIFLTVFFFKKTNRIISFYFFSLSLSSLSVPLSPELSLFKINTKIKRLISIYSSSSNLAASAVTKVYINLFKPNLYYYLSVPPVLWAKSTSISLFPNCNNRLFLFHSCTLSKGFEKEEAVLIIHRHNNSHMKLF